MADYENNGRYGKRPLWQWILIYAAIGLLVYGLIYYFVLAKRGESDTVPQAPIATSSETSSPQATASAVTTLEQNTITLSADGFSPATLTIKAGGTVTWVNNSSVDATVNSAPHPAHTDYPPLNLGAFSSGESLSLMFNQPGTYKYHNHLNPKEFGTVVVE